MIGFNLRSDKYIVIFAKKVNGRYTKLGQKRADPSQSVVSFRHGTYAVNYSQVLYRDGLKNYILIDTENNIQVGDSDSVISQISPQLLDAILSRSIISQLSSRLAPSTPALGGIVMLIVAMVAGIFAGYVLGSLFPVEYLQSIIGSDAVASAGVGGG